MDRSLTYNGSLTAEQFLFYEIRIASGFLLDGKTAGEAIETIQQGNLMSKPLKSIMPVFPNKAAVNSFPMECAIRDRFIPFLGVNPA